jgi:hypothetical protein
MMKKLILLLIVLSVIAGCAQLNQVGTYKSAYHGSIHLNGGAYAALIVVPSLTFETYQNSGRVEFLEGDTIRLTSYNVPQNGHLIEYKVSNLKDLSVDSIKLVFNSIEGVKLDSVSESWIRIFDPILYRCGHKQYLQSRVTSLEKGNCKLFRFSTSTTDYEPLHIDIEKGNLIEVTIKRAKKKQGYVRCSYFFREKFVIKKDSLVEVNGGFVYYKK